MVTLQLELWVHIHKKLQNVFLGDYWVYRTLCYFVAFLFTQHCVTLWLFCLQNFVSGDLERLRDELSADRLDEVRAAGNDVRRHLINTCKWETNSSRPA